MSGWRPPEKGLNVDDDKIFTVHKFKDATMPRVASVKAKSCIYKDLESFINTTKDKKETISIADRVRLIFELGVCYDLSQADWGLNNNDTVHHQEDLLRGLTEMIRAKDNETIVTALEEIQKIASKETEWHHVHLTKGKTYTFGGASTLI